MTCFADFHKTYFWPTFRLLEIFLAILASDCETPGLETGNPASPSTVWKVIGKTDGPWFGATPETNRESQQYSGTALTPGFHTSPPPFPQWTAKGASGKGPRQKTPKIVKKCQNIFDTFRHFSRRAKKLKGAQTVKCKPWTERVAEKGLSRGVSRAARKRRINRELEAKKAHKPWIREGLNREVQTVN